MAQKLITVGWTEVMALPELSVPAIKVKIDTGARTSALHVSHIERFTKDGEEFARFQLQPIRRIRDYTITAEAPIIGEKSVKNSGGHMQVRPVVRTMITIAGVTWPVLITLTSRFDMRFKMLLGREAMRKKILVDPGAQYLQGKRSHRSMLTLYKLR